MKKKIIFVPGKNPKPVPEKHIQYLRRCLLEGVSRQSEAAAQQILDQDAFELCSWNHHFYQQHLDFTPLLESIDNVCRKSRSSPKDRLFAKTWKLALSRFIYQTGDRFPLLIDILADEHVKAMLQDTDRYFENVDGIADQIRKPLIELIRQSAKDTKLLVIGHSMGSVIAYDSLCQMQHHHSEAGAGTSESNGNNVVDLFLTLGSPLGLRYTQERLVCFKNAESLGFPSGIKTWHNVAARGDLVSVDTTLADDFSVMKKNNFVDDIIDHNRDVYCWYRNQEGYNFHSSYGYFVEPTVAQIITQWWLAE